MRRFIIWLTRTFRWFMPSVLFPFKWSALYALAQALMSFACCAHIAHVCAYLSCACVAGSFSPRTSLHHAAHARRLSAPPYSEVNQWTDRCPTLLRRRRGRRGDNGGGRIKCRCRPSRRRPAPKRVGLHLLQRGAHRRARAEHRLRRVAPVAPASAAIGRRQPRRRGWRREAEIAVCESNVRRTRGGCAACARVFTCCRSECLARSEEVGRLRLARVLRPLLERRRRQRRQHAPQARRAQRER